MRAGIKILVFGVCLAGFFQLNADVRRAEVSYFWAIRDTLGNLVGLLGTRNADGKPRAIRADECCCDASSSSSDLSSSSSDLSSSSSDLSSSSSDLSSPSSSGASSPASSGGASSSPASSSSESYPVWPGTGYYCLQTWAVSGSKQQYPLLTCADVVYQVSFCQEVTSDAQWWDLGLGVCHDNSDEDNWSFSVTYFQGGPYATFSLCNAACQ
jgi:hypothetical protein